MQPTEIQFAAENGAPPPIPPQGYSEVAANRSSGDILRKKKKTFHQSKLNELKQSSRVGFQYDARVCSSAHACVVETTIQSVIVWVPVFVLFVWASWCICGCDCVCGGCWSVRIIGSKTGFMQHSEVVPMSGHPQRM